MRPLLKIIKHGVYASLQDRGRAGYRRFGVPVSGPMDFESYYWANTILNNDRNALTLEIFVGGFQFEALAKQTYVLTGAKGQFLINSQPIESWRTFELDKGDILTIEHTTEGQVVYLSVKDGFQETEILGSQSFYLPANIGRNLESGSLLFSTEVNRRQKQVVRGLYPLYRPTIKKKIIRVHKGVHFNLFDERSIHHFISSGFQFTGGNRMGYYFNGEKLCLKDEQNILSEGTQFGTIQVPTSGQPIILMADAQTVGGYPVIGTVVKEDLRYVAQLNMFEEIQFQLVDIVR